MHCGKSLIGTSIATALAAAVGTVATKPDTLWYKTLRKPGWQPPNWAFPLAWTTLYASIAGSSAKVLDNLTEHENEARDNSARQGITAQKRSFAAALGINLVLNAGWSVIFWRGRNNTVAAVEAGALALSSIDLARRAAHVNKAAGAALAPYAAWTTFATALSTAIARRN